MFIAGTKSAGGGFIEATGGIVTDYNGYRIHRFNTSSNFVITKAPVGATFELFIIGGGGGGNNGSVSGPAGGAGGAYWNTQYPCPAPGTYPIGIGAGGAGQLVGQGGANGNKGGNSTFNTSSIIAVGGGAVTITAWSNLGAAGTWTSGVTFSDGGCGAGTFNGNNLANHPRWGDTTDRGRTVYNSVGAFAGSNQLNYYGHASGSGDTAGGGGGGGIGGNGGDGVSTVTGGPGGLGMIFNWVGVNEAMGGGGGGGCSDGVPAGIGGSGVGGNGGPGGTAATNAVANTGSGGGGSGAGNAGNGSSGICIIKYPIA